MVQKQKSHIKSKNNNADMCFKWKVIAVQKVWKKLKEYQRLGPIEINMNGVKKKFSAESKEWKKFQINNKTMAFNVLFSRHNNEEIKQEYISNCNSELENQVLLLHITSGEKWNYLFVKNLPPFLRETTS